MIMWILCAVLTVYDYFPVGHPARTDVKIRIIEDSSWFRVPYPCEIVLRYKIYSHERIHNVSRLNVLMFLCKGQWGWPTVSVAGVVGMLAGVLACTVESISYYPTTAKMCGGYNANYFVVVNELYRKQLIQCIN